MTAVRAVDADTTIASEAPQGAIVPDARAVEAARPLTATRLRVAVEAPAEHASHATELRGGLERSTLVAQAVEGTSPDLQAYVIAPRSASTQPVPQLRVVNSDSWAVVGRDGRLAMPVHAVDEPGVTDVLLENFEKLARYRNGLALSNDAADSAVRGRVELRLQIRAPDGSWQDVRAGADGRLVLHEGDQFRLEVVNRHDVRVYAAILDFGVTGKIDPVYPFNGTSEPIEPGRSLVVGEREVFTFTFPDDFPFVRDPVELEPVEGHETFKVFVVTGKPVAFDWLRQEAVRGAALEEPGALEERAAVENVAREALGDRRRDFTMVRPTSADLEDWTTVELPFVLRRADSNGGGPGNPGLERAQAAPAAPITTTIQPPSQMQGSASRRVIEEEASPVFDPTFARTAALALLVVGLLVLWPLWIVSARVVFGDEPAGSFSELVAIQLVIAGVAATLGGFYLALLDFRGRARAAELASQATEPGERGLAAEAIKATPEILKAFGQLKPVAALLVIAALLFLCATALSWRGLET